MNERSESADVSESDELFQAQPDQRGGRLYLLREGTLLGLHPKSDGAARGLFDRLCRVIVAW